MAAPQPPFYLGPYRVLAELGAGGFATVYRAIVEGELGFTRDVALKVLHGHVVANNPAVVMMLADEARLLARMQHPNIVYVQWFGQLDHPTDGRVFAMMMEFVEGRALRSMLDEQRQQGSTMPLSVALDLHADVARALAFAHALQDSSGQPLQLVHRDLKPDNVMISSQGTIKLLDFGIAKAADRLAEKTRTDMVRGTVHYMSPEQVTGQDIDFRSDLFSFGAMLYECVTGRRLIGQPTVVAALQEVAQFDFERAVERAGELPPTIEPILRRLLKRRPRERYASTDELVADIETARTDLKVLNPTAAYLRDQVAGWMERRAEATAALRGAPVDTARPTQEGAAESPTSLLSGTPPAGPSGQVPPGFQAPPTRPMAGAAVPQRASAPAAQAPRPGTASAPAARSGQATAAASVRAGGGGASAWVPALAGFGVAMTLVAAALFFWGRGEVGVSEAAPARPAETPAPLPTPEPPPLSLSTAPSPTPAATVVTHRSPNTSPPRPNPRAPSVSAPTPTPAPAPDPVATAKAGVFRLTADHPFELHVARKTFTMKQARAGVSLPSGRYEARLVCLQCPAGVVSTTTVAVDLLPDADLFLGEIQFPRESP